MLATWSLRVLIITAGTWLILGTVYFARPAQPLLPSPLNVMLFIILASIAGSSLAVWLSAWTRSSITRHLDELAASTTARLDQFAAEADAREGRVYYAIAAMTREAARLRQMIEDLPTADLSRPVAVAVGDYDAGFADGLARSPMREAKVIPMSPRDSGS